jgi:hypothetical protein
LRVPLMVWTKLDDRYGDDCAPLSDAAFRTHTEALNWTMRRETEGRITTRDLRRFAETAEPDTAVAELVEHDFWEDHDSGDGWTILRDIHYQRTKDQIAADREATAERQRRWREKHGKKKPSSKPEEPPRPEVEELCKHLADRIEGNENKRPNITKAWRDAARLLVDEDKHTVDEVRKAIDWCQSNEFWRRHIMSMSKLREKYDTLRMQATDERKQRGNAANNGHGQMRGGARQELLTSDEVAGFDPGRIV